MNIWEYYNTTIWDKEIPERKFEIGQNVKILWDNKEEVIIIWYELKIKFFTKKEETHRQYSVYIYDEWENRLDWYSEWFLEE